MGDSNGFRRGFLLRTTKKTTKKVSHTAASNVSSALLDLETSPRHSIFAVEERGSHTGLSITEQDPHARKEESPLFTEVKTSRKPLHTLCTKRPDVFGEGNVADDTTTISLTPPIFEKEQERQNPEARPAWLLAEEEESAQPESQMTSELMHAPLEQDTVADKLASTLLRMKRSTDWRKNGSDFVQSHLRTASTRAIVWGLLLEGDLTVAKTRLGLCVLQHGIDLLKTTLRETGSKDGRYRTMRCLAIIEYRLDQDGVSSDLVDSVLPEIGRIAVSEDQRTRLAQQAVEVAIRLISSASLIGSSDPVMAKLLHSKISTVDQLLDKQMDWLGNVKTWFTVDGARLWCKHEVITHWQKVNQTYHVSGRETQWCRELQGGKDYAMNASVASTLLPSSKFPIDNFIGVLRLSLDRKDLSYEASLTGFHAWLSRKGSRIPSEERDMYDCVEILLLDLLTRKTYLIPVLAAL